MSWIYQEAIKTVVFHSAHSGILDSETYSAIRSVNMWHYILVDYVVAPMQAKRRFTEIGSITESSITIKSGVLPNGSLNGPREYLEDGKVFATGFSINGKNLNYVEKDDGTHIIVYTLSDDDEAADDEFVIPGSKTIKWKVAADQGDNQPEVLISTGYGNINLSPDDFFIFKKKEDILISEYPVVVEGKVIEGEYLMLGDLKVAKREPGSVIYLLVLKSSRLELKFIANVSTASRLMGDSNDMFFAIKTAFDEHNVDQLDATVDDIAAWYDWEVEKVTMLGADWY